MADRGDSASSSSGAFLVSAVGQIEKAHFPDFNDMYCKYTFVYGPDWELVTVSTDRFVSLGLPYVPEIVGFVVF